MIMPDWFSLIQNGETALHKAAKYYHTKAVELLVEAGASINKLNDVSYTVICMHVITCMNNNY